MKHSLQLRQSQQLMLTPQLQQAIKLLQLSPLEINQETARLLDENPFLEREDDAPTQVYTSGTSADTASPSGTTESSAPAESDTRDSDSAEWPEPSFSASPSASPDDEDDG